MSAVKVESILSQTVSLDNSVHADAIIYSAFSQQQLSGSQPFVARKSVRTTAELDLPTLLPAGFVITRHYTDPNSDVMLAIGEDATVLLERYRETVLVVAASAGKLEEAKRIVQDIATKTPKAESRNDDLLDISVWYLFGKPMVTTKRISAPSWEDIERNYPAAVRAPLNSLRQVVRPTDAGKLILLHGEPGTGKTTAIRALMRQWQDWCSAQYISDPERLFSHPGYMMEVVGGTTDNGTEKWQLLIAEDSDEYLRVSARKEAGAALGRLLNLSDGVLGQGNNTLVLLTTNERLDRLHPALIRPGRCLAQVEFTKFSPSEAAQWLPDDLPEPNAPKTLAELIELSTREKRITNGIEPATSIGQYL
jgi:Domain of unknown function (DUF5925)/ATPase family associated with various cellular activities (AAA)